jgi:hypothetical protein
MQSGRLIAFSAGSSCAGQTKPTREGRFSIGGQHDSCVHDVSDLLHGQGRLLLACWAALLSSGQAI